jgi:alkanesulfonate monooxygenase SsuD/methylene tetrahydromethanopterin reductase-like flavin-dependent oxidoreductase (luciferase family)
MVGKPLVLVVHHDSMAKINARIADGNMLAALFAFTVQRVRDQLAARAAEPPRCWVASPFDLTQPQLLCLCHECAGPDDDSADKVFRAFGSEIALMVTPAEGNA